MKISNLIFNSPYTCTMNDFDVLFCRSVQAILDDIITDIPSWYDFHFEKTHVEVISGEAEGMYAWISLNYMLGRFSARHTNSGTTAAFIVRISV